ncbi:MAG: GNAT family N-acetyltransferase [Alphaproteobacteria bacterium]|nr:GNAT family N-acetyltransferase [Alphaproteobacteria bacterium]
MLEIRKVENKVDQARSVQIRTLVFVVGQNVPPDREIDAGEETAVYYLGLEDGVPVATVRWQRGNEGMAKIERLAVLDRCRGKGYGKSVMKKLIADLTSDPSVKKIKLGAQDHAIPFYEALGFSVVGDQYEDGGGIPHHDMVLKT